MEVLGGHRAYVLVVICMTVFAALPMSLTAQAGASSMLLCGRNFQLHEPKDVAVRNAADGGCKLIPIGESGSFVLLTDGLHPSAQGVIAFQDAKVASVTKSWNINLTTATSYGEALIRLLQKLQEEGFTTCTLSSLNLSDASVDYHAELIDCGGKQIRLGAGSIGGSKSLDIDEVLSGK